MHNNTQNGSQLVTIKIVFATLLAVSIVFFTWPVAAQVFQIEHKWTCGKTLDLGKELQSAGEQIIGTGNVADVMLITFWANPASRAWTVVATRTAEHDTSCIVLHGKEFKPIEPGPVI